MSDFPSRPSLFSRTLRECRKLFVESGELIERQHRSLKNDASQDYVTLMDDLHRALVLKIYILVCEADRQWSKKERFLAEVLCHHLWGQWLSGDALRDTMKRASKDAEKLTWASILGPFERLPPLRERVGRVETLVSRLANLVARCDGTLNQRERDVLKEIEQAVSEQLVTGRERDRNERDDKQPSEPSTPTAILEETKRQGGDFFDNREARNPRPKRAPSKASNKPKAGDEPPAISVEDALAELDRLIGLDDIKHEVRSLTNFLRLQQKREAAGLPETDISLHMVFTGNPGTGKTTVARIIGKIFQALGVLAKGHLVETDRSGMVADYAGQTATKTNKKLDEALDGLLFIDEAYSLVAKDSEDPYGREAVQVLLKRAEDDRDRMVVIVAGYPDEMQDLLRSNPGLSSRFSRQLQFKDYSPLELSRIFGLMCRKNHYELTPEARLKVMLGMQWAFDTRDRHFGNGRMSRNLFEHAVRRMANRLASDADVDQRELVTLQAVDIEFRKAPAAVFEDLDESKIKLQLSCPECQHSNDAPTKFLGKKVKCPKCQKEFPADWADLLPVEPAAS